MLGQELAGCSASETIMRLVAVQEQIRRTKRVMLVDNPQDQRYAGGVICYLYLRAEDGPSEGGAYYPGCTLTDVMVQFRDEHGLELTAWSQIPDQLPGCLDDWIAPVRTARDERGKPLIGEWEKLVGNDWVRFKNTTAPFPS